MKVTITFTLPDEQVEYDNASQGAKYKDALTEVAMAFRQHRKYDGPPVTEDTFHSILDDCDVSVE